MMKKGKISHAPHDKSDWKCLCGSTWESQGFHECDTEGNALDDETVCGPDTLFFCCNCGRIINEETLEVYGMRSEGATDLVSVMKSARPRTHNTPQAITPNEFKEITESPELQEIWGAEDAGELQEILANDYIAKFATTTPKYNGDLFVIQADTLDADIPAMRLYRGRGGQLVVLR